MRQLPEPLLTYELYANWIAAYRTMDHEERLRAIKRLADQLPRGNHDTLAYLAHFMAGVCKVLLCARDAADGSSTRIITK